MLPPHPCPGCPPGELPDELIVTYGPDPLYYDAFLSDDLYSQRFLGGPPATILGATRAVPRQAPGINSWRLVEDQVVPGSAGVVVRWTTTITLSFCNWTMGIMRANPADPNSPRSRGAGGSSSGPGQPCFGVEPVTAIYTISGVPGTFHVATIEP